MPYHRCASCGLTSYSAAGHVSARACPTCAAELTDDSRLYVVPGSKRDVMRTLPVRPEAAAQARHAVAALALSEADRDNLGLLVTELATNVVRHAGLAPTDMFSVQLTNSDAGVRLAVHDAGPGFVPPSPEAADVLGTTGRGLIIVASLADSWGVDCDGDGCTVWCEIPTTWPDEAEAPRRGSGFADPLAVSNARLAI